MSATCRCLWILLTFAASLAAGLDAGRAADERDPPPAFEGDWGDDLSPEFTAILEETPPLLEEAPVMGDDFCLPECNYDWGWLPRGHAYHPALERTPEMLGDYTSIGTIAVQTNAIVSNYMRGSLPLAGAGGLTKVVENNRALPTDRVYFNYNHLHRTLHYQRSVDAASPFFKSDEFSVDRYTFGIEKTFLADAWSVELRMPLTDSFDYSDRNPLLPAVTDFRIGGGDVGDLSVILKRILYVNPFFALSAGIGVTAPTGSDVEGSLPAQSPPVTYTIFNESIHVLPYLGFTATEGDRWFMHSFIQFDIPSQGNRVEAQTASGTQLSGIWNDPTLFYFDIGFGYWFRRAEREDAFLPGIAGLLEYHYAAPIDGNDQFRLFGAGVLYTPNDLENIGNVTGGIHVEITPRTSLRGGVVVPLESFPNRSFDITGQASVIRRF